MDISDKIRDQITSDLAIELNSCPDRFLELFELEDLQVKWDFKQAPGQFELVTGKGIFRVNIKVSCL